jgi:hypothetical protein
MNFAMTTPTRNQGFARGGGASPAIVTPPEPVTATVHANRIVAVTLPFNTPRAASIRQYFQYRVLTELNERMFVYRRETDNKWTTIHRATPRPPCRASPCSPTWRRVHCRSRLRLVRMCLR